MANLAGLREKLARLDSQRVQHLSGSSATGSAVGTPEAENTTAEHTGNTTQAEHTGNTTGEITDHKSWLAIIEQNGNQPSDWLEYMNFTQTKVKFANEEARVSWLTNQYAKLVKVIPETLRKRSKAYAQLLVNFAQFRSKYSEEDARNIFSMVRFRMYYFAFVYVANAQFELDCGNRDKCQKLLMKGRDSDAQPRDVLNKAYRNLVEGKKKLLDEDDVFDLTWGCRDSADLGSCNLTAIRPVSKTEEFLVPVGSARKDTALLKPKSSFNNPMSTGSLLQPRSSGTTVSTSQALDPKFSGTSQTLGPKFSGTSQTLGPKFSGTSQTLGPKFSGQSQSSSQVLEPVCSASRPKQQMLSMQGEVPQPVERLSANAQPSKAAEKTEATMEDGTVSFKPPSTVTCRRSNTSGTLSEDGDTVPAIQDRQSGLCHRTLRTSRSTPDCKNPGSEFRHIWSSQRLTRSKPQRVLSTPAARTSLPELGGRALEKDDGSIPMQPLPETPQPARVPSGTATAPADTSLTMHTEPTGGDMTDCSEPSRTSLDSGLGGEPRIPADLDGITPMEVSPDAPNPRTSGENGNVGGVAPHHSPELIPQKLTNNTTLNSTNSTLKACPLPSQPHSGNVADQIASQCSTATVQSRPAPVVPDSHYSAPTRQPQPVDPRLLYPGNVTPMPSALPAPVMPHQPAPHQYAYPQAMSKQNVLVVSGKVYTIMGLMGKGGSSKVHQALNEKGKLVAIKCVDMEGADEATVMSYMNEIALLQRLQYSSRVIRMYDHEYSEDTNTLYVVMERGDTDLAALLWDAKKRNEIPEVMQKFYFNEMLEAVNVLHKEGIVHCDLKPANFLLVAGRVKLIDFGIANAIQQDKTSVTRDQQVGTLNYISPEAIMDISGGTQFDEEGRVKPRMKIGVKSDVWSLGCILCNMVFGRTPFQHIKNQILKMQAITNKKHPIELPATSDPHLCDVIKSCLRRDPSERPAIEELLQHPYLRGPTKAPSPVLPPDVAKENSPPAVNAKDLLLKKLQSADLNSPRTMAAFDRFVTDMLHQKGKPSSASTPMPRIPLELRQANAGHHDK